MQDGVDRFRRPEYRRLLAAARRSLEHTGGDLGRSVTVASPNEAERKAIIRLTGHYRPPVAGRIAVRLADLDEAARPESAADRRPLWDSAEVVADDLASRVLVLNLAAGGTGLGECLTGAAR